MFSQPPKYNNDNNNNDDDNDDDDDDDIVYYLSFASRYSHAPLRCTTVPIVDHDVSTAYQQSS